MKKVSTILFTVIVMFTVFCVNAGAEMNPDFAGRWTVVEMAEGEESINVAEYGIEMVFDLLEDGTVEADLMGEKSKGSWMADGTNVTISIEGDSASATVEDGVMCLEEKGTVLKLVKNNGSEQKTDTEAVPETVDGPGTDDIQQQYGNSDIAGTWFVEEMTEGESTFILTDLGIEMTFDFQEDGILTADMMGDKVTGSWTSEGSIVRITMEGDTVSAEVGNGVMSLEEKGTVMKLRKADGTELEQEKEPTPEPAPEKTAEPSAAPAAVPMPSAGENDYAGVWNLIYIGTGGFTGNASDIGLAGETLTLKDDHTGILSVDADTVIHKWWMEDGIVRLDDQRLVLLRSDILQYGNEMSGYMIFSKDPDMIWDGSIAMYNPFANIPENPTEAPVVPQATEAPAAKQDSGNIRTEVKYTAKSYVAAGYELDASVLGGEYSIILHDNGTVTFTMVGTDVPNLLWKMDNDSAVIDYYGSGEIRITAEGEGISLDLFGTMTLKMIP